MKINNFFKSVISILIIITLCVVIGYITNLNSSLYNKLTDGINIDIDVKELKDKYDYGEIKEFMILAGRFAYNHNYSDNYNCINYTRDLHKIADSLGFYTEEVRGCPDNNKTCHRWLRLSVDFEPQEGSFVDYSVKYPNQYKLEE